MTWFVLLLRFILALNGVGDAALDAPDVTLLTLAPGSQELPDGHSSPDDAPSGELDGPRPETSDDSPDGQDSDDGDGPPHAGIRRVPSLSGSTTPGPLSDEANPASRFGEVAIITSGWWPAGGVPTRGPPRS
jgi:hypothetical protein